jgi:hypothetical protein
MRFAEQVEVFDSLDALPVDAAPLFDAAAGGFFSTRSWWAAVLAHAIPPCASPRLLLIRLDGAAKALFPMLLDMEGGGLRALTTPYTCLYEPLLADDPDGRTAVFAALARYCRSFPTTRLDALDQALATDIARGARRNGLAVAMFDHFGNWHEDVAGLDWNAWLAARPGALRETIRRPGHRHRRFRSGLRAKLEGAGALPGVQSRANPRRRVLRDRAVEHLVDRRHPRRGAVLDRPARRGDGIKAGA